MDDFEEVWDVIEKLKMRAFVGSAKKTADLFSEANRQLKVDFPNAKSRFYVHHLKSAKLDQKGNLACVLEFVDTTNNTNGQTFIATCQRVAGNVSVKISR